MSIATNRIALWASAFATLFVVGALYWQTLRFGFIWDDIQIVYGRVDYHSPARWLEAVRQPLDFSPNYFRPLALSSLLVQIWIWRDNPAPFHFVNVLLHLLNTILVIALALRILAGRWYGALVGALYGIHPALVESVAFISSRYDLTATLFMLLGLISLRRLRPDLAELEFQKAYRELVRPQGMAPDVELRRLRNASPWIEAAEYWMLQGDLVLAEKLLQTAAQRNPDKVAYRIALARLRILQNRKVEARALLQDLVEAGYENQEVRNLLIEARKQK